MNDRELMMAQLEEAGESYECACNSGDLYIYSEGNIWRTHMLTIQYDDDGKFVGFIYI